MLKMPQLYQRNFNLRKSGRQHFSGELHEFWDSCQAKDFS